MEKKVINSYKIIVIGDSGTGKSSLILQFTNNVFSNSYHSTIGVDFRTKIFQVDDNIVRLYIWDTAGQERFKSITRSYYNTAEGIILVFDITNKKSFESLPLWLNDFIYHGKTNLPIILVGTKNDKHDIRQVQIKDIDIFIENYIKQFNISYIETSAKYDINIHNVFINMGKELLKIKTITNSIKHTDSTININENKSKNCCSIS